MFRSCKSIEVSFEDWIELHRDMFAAITSRQCTSDDVRRVEDRVMWLLDELGAACERFDLDDDDLALVRSLSEEARDTADAVELFSHCPPGAPDRLRAVAARLDVRWCEFGDHLVDGGKPADSHEWSYEQRPWPRWSTMSCCEDCYEARMEEQDEEARQDALEAAYRRREERTQQATSRVEVALG